MINDVLRGVVHGNTIELFGDIGIRDGAQVEVVVRSMAIAGNEPGAGFVRSEGALADDAEWDAVMTEIYAARKSDRQSPWPDA